MVFAFTSNNDTDHITTDKAESQDERDLLEDKLYNYAKELLAKKDQVPIIKEDPVVEFTARQCIE